MLFVWRGIGIIVPIVIFIVGWIVSFWFEDTRLGNGTFMGWVFFYSAIVFLLLGAGALGLGEPKKREDGTPMPKKKHDFFFIPIILWAPIMGALSAWLLLGGGEKKEQLSDAPETPVYDTIRRIRFYNPTSDTLLYVISDKYGYFEKEKLDPFTCTEILAPEESYLLAGLRTTGESTQALPGTKDFDSTKYEEVKEGDTFIYQRIITKPSAATNDYEDAWVLLSSGFDMAVIDVSGLYEANLIEKKKVEGINWMEKIHSKHPGNELIEPLVKPAAPYKTVHVVNPNTLLPLICEKNEAVYVLIAYPFDTELTNEYIVKKISRLFVE